jgi:hypothetical protein
MGERNEDRSVGDLRFETSNLNIVAAGGLILAAILLSELSRLGADAARHLTLAGFSTLRQYQKLGNQFYVVPVTDFRTLGSGGDGAPARTPAT